MIKSTLNKFEDIRPGRQTGNTTRMIDHAIQMIFQDGGCIVEDHWMDGNSKSANKNFMFRILDRLSNEHNIQHLIDTDKLIIDKDKMEIRFFKYGKTKRDNKV